MRSVTGILFSLLEAIPLGSLVLLEFGVGPIGLRGCLKSPGRSRLTVRGPGFAPAVWKLEWGNIVGEI